MNITEQEIAYLGICERVKYHEDVYTLFPKWDILGLKSVLPSYIFPFDIEGVNLGLAVTQKMLKNSFHIFITDQDENEIGKISISSKMIDSPSVGEKVVGNKNQPLFQTPQIGWFPVFIPFPKGIMIWKPGLYNIYINNIQQDTIIGQFTVGYLKVDPLTHDQIAAIKSDPNGVKALRLVLKCSKCQEKFKVYSALEKDEELENEGYLYYSMIADFFECGCKATRIDLKYIQENLHSLHLRSSQTDSKASFLPLYEKSSIEKIRSNYIDLIDSNPKEQVVQTFIEENLIILHQFPATKIIFKPPILTMYNTDFAIVTPQKQLLLIELEKPSTKLLKKDGGLHSELNHAFDQVRDWLHECGEHRLAILDTLKIDRNQVGSIRGIVIAGRDSNYEKNALRRLKGATINNIEFLTYDDLLISLDTLIKEMHRM